jgi:glycine/sarcosine N-methyltransferase
MYKTMDEYKILADVYDIFHPVEDVISSQSFFEHLVQKYNITSVLDCACGTGLHLALFNDIGLTCFGSDISPEMLEEAKYNVQGKSVQLKTEDFRTLGRSWNDTYNMVTCLTDSLPHMMTDEDIIIALNSMYDRVAEGGILVISNDITDALLDAKTKFIPARVLQNEAFYVITEYPNEEELSFDILYVKKTEESFDHLFTSLRYNAMRKTTLERCFAKTQFTNVQYYGDYEMGEYSKEKSNKLIVVAEK